MEAYKKKSLSSAQREGAASETCGYATVERSELTKKINGEKLKITIILPYFNEKLGLELYKNAKEELFKNHVREKNISLIRVTGALEIPFACQKIAEKIPKKDKKNNGIIALGVVIRGETTHYQLVTKTTYQGIMQVQLKTGIPIAFGILACENLEQAEKRVDKNGFNKGREAAQAILIQSKI